MLFKVQIFSNLKLQQILFFGVLLTSAPPPQNTKLDEIALIKNNKSGERNMFNFIPPVTSNWPLLFA